jgi:beta-galactosidase
LEAPDLGGLKFQKLEKVDTSMPAFYRATFDLNQAGDTFLDFHTWGKGIAWVNGHNLGRFWNSGPQQTLYCPAPWLKKGRNELIVFELNGATWHVVSGLAEPILNQVAEAAPIKKHRAPGQAPNLTAATPVASGSFGPGKEWQTVTFPPTPARFVCLEALSSHSGDPFTTCAELQLIDPAGKDLPRETWKIAYADSEEVDGDDGNAENVFDLQSSTFWHTQWESAQPAHPHQLVLDLGGEHTVAGLRYLPRQDSANGRIKEYRVFLSKAPFPGLTNSQ